MRNVELSWMQSSIIEELLICLVFGVIAVHDLYILRSFVYKSNLVKINFVI